jgi:uncharacterized glyoxalase superfamily protein PhnB
MIRKKHTFVLFLLSCLSLANVELNAQSLVLTQIQLQTTDPKAAADWYVKHLGFKSKSVRQVAERTYASVTMGDLMILFAPAENPKPNMLSFRSDDIKKLYDALVAGKVEIKSTLNSLPMSPENEKNFGIEDPWGNYLHFDGTVK